MSAMKAVKIAWNTQVGRESCCSDRLPCADWKAVSKDKSTTVAYRNWERLIGLVQVWDGIINPRAELQICLARLVVGIFPSQLNSKLSVAPNNRHKGQLRFSPRQPVYKKQAQRQVFWLKM